MSRIDHSPDWRRLCQAALFEVNRVKLVDRIAVARRAILRRIETGHSKSSDEQIALRQSLATLDSLRRITEFQDTQSKAS